MNFEYQLSTPREDFYNITPQVREAVAKSGVADGIARSTARIRRRALQSMKTPILTLYMIFSLD